MWAYQGESLLFVAWQEWFGDHIYRAVLVASILEGLGLPIPTEVLFVPAIALAAKGDVSLLMLVLLATLGNTLGGLIGYGVAFKGGQAFFQTASRWFGIKPEAQRKMESYFARHGQTTVFLSRFIGFIRAATIYSAGAARMPVTRFAIYIAAGGLVWYGGWLFVIRRFSHAAFRLLRGGPGSDRLYWLLVLLLLFVAGRYILRWYKRRKPTHL